MLLREIMQVAGIYGIPWKLVKSMIFMEKSEIHVKMTRRQPSAPEAENSSNSYTFLHGSEAVRVLLEPEWWNSLNSTYFSRIPPFWWNLVKFGDFTENHLKWVEIGEKYRSGREKHLKRPKMDCVFIVLRVKARFPPSKHQKSPNFT